MKTVYLTAVLFSSMFLALNAMAQEKKPSISTKEKLSKQDSARASINDERMIAWQSHNNSLMPVISLSSNDRMPVARSRDRNMGRKPGISDNPDIKPPVNPIPEVFDQRYKRLPDSVLLKRFDKEPLKQDSTASRIVPRQKK